MGNCVSEKLHSMYRKNQLLFDIYIYIYIYVIKCLVRKKNILDTKQFLTIYCVCFAYDHVPSVHLSK